LRGLQEGIGWKGSLNAVKQVERDGRSAIEFNERGQNIVWLDNFEFNEGIIANLKITHRAAETARPAVPRWQPHDFAFTASEASGNPFEVGMSAVVKGPDGQTFTLPGFYDGNNAWKVRVSPTIVGDWSLVTQSDLPALNGQREAFACVANPSPQVHGGLRVDPKHPHHFIHEDGTRYFLMGYECDWLWALDMDDPHLPRVNPFLDKLAAHGFNYIILNSYAHDTGWRKGKTGADDYGPMPGKAPMSNPTTAGST